jgi:hypothetical protein
MQTDWLQHAAGESNPAVLDEFVAETLSESDRAVVVAHIGVCGECRGILALLTPEEGPPSPRALAAQGPK